MAQQRTRIIYYGDNLDILQAHIAAESVHLVYLDPPFKSQQEYNLLFRTVKGAPAEAQVRAFSDTWKWTPGVKATCDWLLEDPKVPGKVSEMIRAFHSFLGPSEMLAYLVMMTPRLMELHRALKPTGSLYLHCDPTASHYLKLVLDTIFGPGNFRNEIAWRRFFSHNDPKRYGANHDIILFYTKGNKWAWNVQYTAHRDDYVSRDYRFAEGPNGEVIRLKSGEEPPLGWRRFRQGDLTANRPGGDVEYEWKGVRPYRGRYWAYSKENMEAFEREGRLLYRSTGMPVYKRYLDEMPGVPLQAFWDDISPIISGSKEMLGYPTQKPIALLKRIIQASTNPGDLVLDPFCGCGTALVAAEELGRSWVGIDITYLAVDVMARRLHDHFPNISFEIQGQPQDEEGARALAERDRFQFQVWALSQVSAQPLDPDRKGADRGIDGYLPFLVGAKEHQRAIVQVKSGHVGVKEVRDLRGTLEREKAPFALFITLEPPTEPMKREAAEAGFYQVPATGEPIPRLQILTIRELLQGQRPRLPTTQISPVPTAPRLKLSRGRQLPLGNQPQAD